MNQTQIINVVVVTFVQIAFAYGWSRKKPAHTKYLLLCSWGLINLAFVMFGSMNANSAPSFFSSLLVAPILWMLILVLTIPLMKFMSFSKNGQSFDGWQPGIHVWVMYFSVGVATLFAFGMALSSEELIFYPYLAVPYSYAVIASVALAVAAYFIARKKMKDGM